MLLEKGPVLLVFRTAVRLVCNQRLFSVHAIERRSLPHCLRV